MKFRDMGQLPGAQRCEQAVDGVEANLQLGQQRGAHVLAEACQPRAGGSRGGVVIRCVSINGCIGCAGIAQALEVLAEQAANNSKEQFGNSPDLAQEIMDAIMDAFAAHSSMSKQALGSEHVRQGIRDALLGPGQLWEELRARGNVSPAR